MFSVSDQQPKSLDLTFKSGSISITDDNIFSHVDISGEELLHANQLPDLPVFVCPIALPDDILVQVDVISADTVMLNYPVVPGRGLSIGAPIGDFVMGKVYRSNKVFPAQMAQFGSPYFLHNVQGRNLQFVPFQYFPQSGMLIIIKQARIHIESEQGIASYASGIFAKVDQQHFINIKEKQSYRLRSSSLVKPSMLIICPSEFLDQAQKFAQWKIHQGTTCYVESVSSNTTAETIKTITTEYYNKKSISYLLIIGDSEQIPAMLFNGDSDAAYGFIAGNDAYAEVAVGRISAITIAEASLQLTRIEQYERHQMPTRNNSYIMVASGEGPGDDDEFDFEHLRNIKAQLDTYGFVPGSELYDGNRGGDDVLGNPTSADLIGNISNGADLLFYLGHGDANSLQTTHTTTTDAPSFDNSQWPYAMIGGCQVGNFVGKTCFAESMLRAGSIDQPTGFVAMLASSNDQFWAPPMRAQDAFAESIMQTEPQTLGQHIQAAFRNMNTVYGQNGEETASTWNLFGDPSMYLHTRPADTITAELAASFVAGTTAIKFNANRDGAYYALSRNGVLVADGLCLNGENTCFVNPLLPGEYLFSIFAPNSVSFVQTFTVDLSTEQMLAVQSVATDSDPTGNSIDCSHPVALGVFLQNVSTQPISGAELVLSSLSPTIFIEPLNVTISDIQSGETIWVDSIAILSCKNVPSSYSFSYTIDISTTVPLSKYQGALSAETPQYIITDSRIHPTVGSNSNNIVEAGEIVSLSLVLVNENKILSSPDYLDLQTSENIIAENIRYTIGEDSIKIDCEIAVSPNALSGEIFSVFLKYGNDHYWQTAEFEYPLVQACEYWGATESALPWDFVADVSWQIDISPEGDTSLRSGVVGADGKSRVQIQYTSGAKDTISFAKDTISFAVKISCEQSVDFGNYTDYYDYLEFTIDSVSQQKWAGQVDWREYRFAVDSGTHVFAWEYVKDYDTDEGLDAAWIDNICFPVSAEYFVPPLVFSLPDTISLYKDDTLALPVSLPADCIAANLFGTPQWLDISAVADGWMLSGIALDTGVFHVRLSCNTASRYSHASTIVQVRTRPVARLSFSALAESSNVASGDSVLIHISVANSGNASSSADTILISTYNNLLSFPAEILIPEILPAGEFLYSFKMGTPKCLQSNASDTISFALDFAGQILSSEVPINIIGNKFYIDAISFVPGEINNSDSILQTGEQLKVYTTIHNLSAVDLPATISINTDLGNWTFEENVNAVSLMSFYGNEILVPKNFVADPFVINTEIQVGECKYSATRNFETRQSSVPEHDTLWLAHTTENNYQLCLPDSVRFVVLENNTLLLRDLQCLNAQLNPLGDTVVLGKVAMLMGESTGISTIMVRTEKIVPVAILSISALSENSNVASGDSVLIHISVVNSGNTTSSADTILISTYNNLLSFPAVIPVPQIIPVGEFLYLFKIGTPKCLQSNVSDTIAFVLDFEEQILSADVPINIIGNNIFIDSIGFVPSEINNGDSILQTGEQLLVYTSVHNLSTVDLHVTIYINTDLGNWTFEENVNAGSLMSFYGNEFLVPQNWATDPFVIDAEIQIAECKYSATRSFETRQSSVPEHDTLWLTHTTGNDYQLCLPDSVRFVVLENDPLLSRNLQCLNAQLYPLGDTVILGRVTLLWGENTGISTIAASTEKLTSQNISIIPNFRWMTADNILTVWCSEPIGEIVISNMSGQIILNEIVRSGQPISLKLLPTGVYLVLFRDKSSVGNFELYAD